MKPVDLTMSISPRLPTFPGSPSPQFIQWNRIHDSGYNLELVFFSTHTGTHLDAPYHFAEGGRKIHQIPVDRLMRRASLIRLPGSDNRGITVDDITGFEDRSGPIKKDDTLIFNTGWSGQVGRASYFERNPGLTADAARYIAAKGVNLVGIDSPSIDLGTARGFPAHGILAENDILILENLINLEKIRGAHFDLVVLPLKIQGATGSPVRAVAVQRTSTKRLDL